MPDQLFDLRNVYCPPDCLPKAFLLLAYLITDDLLTFEGAGKVFLELREVPHTARYLFEFTVLTALLYYGVVCEVAEQVRGGFRIVVIAPEPEVAVREVIKLETWCPT